MSSFRICGLAGVLATMVVADWAFGQSEWIGRKVFDIDTVDCLVSIGDTIVDKYKTFSFPDVVMEVNGEWLYCGRCYLPKRDVRTLEQAFEYYDEQVKRNPSSADVWLRRGICWVHQGKLKNAIQDFDEAIRLNPKDVGAFNIRGNTKADLKEFAGAMRDYDEAIRRDPKYPEAYNNRGWVKERQKDYAGAIQDYDEAIRLDPKAVYCRNHKAFLLATAEVELVRNAVKALALTEEALSKRPNNEYVLSSKACALAAMGKFDEAIKVQELAKQDVEWRTDESWHGGKHLEARVAAWKEMKLWHPKR